MTQLRRPIATALLLLTSLPAFASGADGILTFVVGVPSLAVVSAALLWMLRRPRSTLVKLISSLFLGPPALYALYLIPDALSLFRYGFRGDATIAVVFFGLLVLVCSLAYRLVRQAKAVRGV